MRGHIKKLMSLFLINNDKVKKILPLKVGLEKNIQNIFEKNLNEILDIIFLTTEYSTGFGGRIDTLGIDNNGSPVIIEYKRNQNNSVINQGLSYLLWLLDHKADFEVLVDKAGIDLDIDWASPRVICVAESYNKFDLDTANLLPMNIELLKYRVYENNTLFVEQEIQRKVKVSTAKIFDKKEKDILKEKVQHNLNDHLVGTNKSIRELFEIMKEKIFEIDNSIIEEPKAKYIAYKLTTNFVDVVILKDSLKIFLNIPSGQLNDPYHLARDLAKPKKIGHWGNGDYEIKLSNKADVDKLMDLVKQSYTLNK